MTSEIQLISDGDGLAVIGEASAVELFLASEGLTSRDLALPRLSAALSTGSAAAQAGAELAANSGRWVKLTEESVKLVKKHGLMETKTPGVSYAMIGNPGNVKSWLQTVKGPKTLLTNPALLSGAAGIMAQAAMQQSMDEITDYLAVIDEKVDDVLRAQKDTVLARVIGVAFVLEEAMTLREHRGRVDEVTWSKVQAAPSAIAETQAYALRQLDALADKLERKSKIGDLAKAAQEIEPKAQEWLAVLARCFQLQDAIAVLELDRVLDASPDELDGHRLGLKAARRDRLETISECTERLMARMDAAAGRANSRVLLHPKTAPAIVESSQNVTTAVTGFQGRLGIESGRQAMEARRWLDAADDVREKVLATGADGLDASKRLGNEGLDLARSVKGKVTKGIAELSLREGEGEEEIDHKT